MEIWGTHIQGAPQKVPNDLIPTDFKHDMTDFETVGSTILARYFGAA